MTDYFIDSSALTKRYVVEPGSQWIQAITIASAKNGIAIAYITPVEIMSAAMRQVREGRISARTARAIRLTLHRRVDRQYVVIEFSDRIISIAEDLVEKHVLRAYDSVQLASALEANQRLIMAGALPLIFVSGDQRLLAAASVEGLAVDDPYQHP